MTEAERLLEDAVRKVATLPREEQDAIASQIIETLEDEAAWKELSTKRADPRPPLCALPPPERFRPVPTRRLR